MAQTWKGNCPDHGQWENWLEDRCVYEVWKEINDKRPKKTFFYKATKKTY